MVYRILDKLVATELVEDTIKTKVVPYVQRRGLNLDNVLLSYVKVRLSPLVKFILQYACMHHF